MDLSNISATAFLIADQTRVAILMRLMDGRALPAGELAIAAGVTAQTACSHLARLLEGGFVMVETEGRHRYYRLSGSHVAQAIEHLATIRSEAPRRAKTLSPLYRQLRFCRRCYDHLAGQVGVALTRTLEERDYIRPVEDKQYAVTDAGARWFADIGLDVASIMPTRRGLARQCLDCTERVHHLAGPLGVHFMATLCEKGWLRRAPDSRAVTVTPKGWVGLRQSLDISEERIAVLAQPRETPLWLSVKCSGTSEPARRRSG